MMMFFIYCIIMTVYYGMYVKKNTPEVIISGIPQPEDFGVMDTAGVLSKASGDLFNSGSLELQNASGGEIFVATFENLPEKDISASDDSQVNIDDFATYLFNEIGLGSSDKNNGVLILFTTEEPHVVLRIGTGLQGCISDGLAGHVLDQYAVNDMYEEMWNHAAVKTWRETARLVYQCYQGTVPSHIENMDLSNIDETPGVRMPFLKMKGYYEDTRYADYMVVLFIVLGFIDGIILAIDSASAGAVDNNDDDTDIRTRGSSERTVTYENGRLSSGNSSGRSGGGHSHGGGRTSGGGASR